MSGITASPDSINPLYFFREPGYDGRVSTIKDIAKAAGVGIGTVSRVLNGSPSVSDETRRRVEDAVAELGYVPNAAARQLASGGHDTRLIGVLMPHFTHPFYFRILRGIHRFLAERDVDMILFNRGQNPSLALNRIMQEPLTGLLVLSHPLESAEEERLSRKGIRYCLVDYRREGARGVSIDNEEGGRIAARYLAGRGCARFGYLGAAGNFQQQEDRLRGFTLELEARGKDAPVVRYSGAGVYAPDACRALITEDGVDGIFFFSDELVLETAAVLDEQGSSLPVIGYDDIDASRYVGLTTVRQPIEDLGYEGARILLDGADERTVIAPTLVERRPHPTVRE